MFILTVPWDVRAIWSALTLTARFYLVCLLVAAGVTTYLLCGAIFRIRRLRNSAASIDMATARRSTSKIRGRIENIRQLHLLLFFLFGMVFTNEMFACVRTIGNSVMSLSPATVNISEPGLALGFVVFALILSLHIFQWIAAYRLQTFLAVFPGSAVALESDHRR